MEKKKVFKKALKSLLSDAMHQALGQLELHEPSKKLLKFIDKGSKKMAVEFSEILKKESRRVLDLEKSLTYVEDVLNGRAEKKSKKIKKEKVEIL
jgi:hypothetical protein